MVRKMSFKKENGSTEERWEAGKEREKKGREDESQRKRGRKEKRKFFFKKKGAHTIAAEQRLIYMHYFDFKLFLAWLLLYSLLHT